MNTVTYACYNCGSQFVIRDTEGVMSLTCKNCGGRLKKADEHTSQISPAPAGADAAERSDQAESTVDHEENEFWTQPKIDLLSNALIGFVMTLMIMGVHLLVGVFGVGFTQLFLEMGLPEELLPVASFVVAVALGTVVATILLEDGKSGCAFGFVSVVVVGGIYLLLMTVIGMYSSDMNLNYFLSYTVIWVLLTALVFWVVNSKEQKV